MSSEVEQKIVKFFDQKILYEVSLLIFPIHA